MPPPRHPEPDGLLHLILEMRDVERLTLVPPDEAETGWWLTTEFGRSRVYDETSFHDGLAGGSIRLGPFTNKADAEAAQEIYHEFISTT